jgi:pentatricopeptide repeat protein
MSFICSSAPSTSGSLVTKVAPRQVLSFLYPAQHTVARRAKGRRRKETVENGKAEGFENWFISSLARAGTCPQHSSRSLPSSTFFNSRRPEVLNRYANDGGIRSKQPRNTKGISFMQRAPQSTASKFHDPEDVPLSELGMNVRRLRKPSKEELLDLVDQYNNYTYTDQLPSIELPKLYPPSDGPHLTVSNKKEDEWPPPEHAWPADMETKRKLQAIDLALLDFHQDPEDIFKLYRQLPPPRVPYLTANARHKLLRHLAVVEKKSEHSMLRYLSVVDDMKNTAIPLSTHEWTSAISFVSRYVTRATEIEVEAALHMWREMEHAAQVRGTGATFNVLFDVACKAGKFALAEMVYKEMEARGHEFNRYHHVSLIYYYGLKRNGDGARQAYRELVEAGEMVDTVVLNAMISAFINAMEPDAAENTYQRMKNKCLEAAHIQPPSRNYKAKRLITKTLMSLARKAKASPKKRAAYYKKVSLVPDSQTFKILVKYYAVQAGDLTKTAELLNNMKLFQLPVQGSLFIALFKGFMIHGGVLHTEWTEEHLNRVFKGLIEAIDEGVEDLYISKWMVVWILKAYAKCSTKPRIMEVWETLQSKWKPSEHDMEFVMVTLRPLLEDADVNIKDEWVLGV